MKILTVRSTETVCYAAEELKKYIIALSRGAILPEICYNQKDSDGDSIVLGTLEELSLDRSDLSDPFIEDIIDVKVAGLSGYIAGSNERSILMGVYKYCASAGCRYIRPGEGGDYIPEADLVNHSFTYRKKADYPFRGECSEGAISYEHMRDTVYYLPKIGMNMYMIEGLVPFTYMHKWYGHVYNTRLRQKGQVTDYAMLEKYIARLERDIKKTGIQLHTLGHGWMFEKFGIHHTDAASEAQQIAGLTDKQKSLLALVNGKRDLCHNSTFFTHFCYSNPEARKLLVDFMVEYLEKKPHVDFVHAWLADSTNNQCECEECQKLTPSDWYVMLLNELDEALTKKNINSRVVFIMYVDTVRPPEKLRLNNPNRFILLSAIGMHYEHGYIIEEYTGEVPPFVRNQHVTPPNALRLRWHKEWKALCNNIPSVIFEYRFYTDMYCDLGQMQITRETYRDMRSLESISFNGCMSDQTHRMYMPTALPLVAMGETLFDKSIDLDTLKRDYLDGAFGDDAGLVAEYLEKLSVLLCPSNFRLGGKNGVEEEGLGNIEASKKPWTNNPEVAESAKKIPSLIDEFLPTIERNIAMATDNARFLSWIYLKHHTEICRRHAAILCAGASGNMEKAHELFAELREYLSEVEPEIHNVFDVYLYLRAMSNKLRIKMPSYYE